MWNEAKVYFYWNNVLFEVFGPIISLQVPFGARQVPFGARQEYKKDSLK